MKRRIIVFSACMMICTFDWAEAGPGWYGGGDYTANYAYGWVGQGLGGYPGPFPGKIPKDPDREFTKSPRRFFRQNSKGIAPSLINNPINPPVSRVPTNAGGATFLVILPENADLFVDGKKSDRTGQKRLIFSPELIAGRLYSYTFKAIWLDMGESKEEAREVFFRLGDEVNVPLGPQK
ncbi:MAG: TIGR03000 domain-containing protein [Planctomycetes bacterium]|nr:TIGR03000 domain-containing protein [Planctomycetota bacterium]